MRFPQELQRGDDLDAYCELPYGARVLGVDTWAQLHLLMNDVRRHAGLAQAGPCTTSQALSATSAVVTCGAQHVVIHVESNDTALGVEIGDWHVHQDVYRGPHTHAFTTVDLW